LILGDSHAIDLFGVVASNFDNPFIIGVAQGGCRPHTNYSYCHYDAVQEFIENHPKIFNLVIYEQAGFYLLQERDGTAGSRQMFSDIKIDGKVEPRIVDAAHVQSTAKFLAKISETVPVRWFLPRAEPHISMRTVLKYGCDHAYTYRTNQRDSFEKLDDYIEQHIAEAAPHKIRTVRQNRIFGFNFPSDFMNCHTIYWSDGDHFSAAGEKRFGERLPKSFLTP